MSSEHTKRPTDSPVVIGSVKRTELWLTKDVKRLVALIIVVAILVTGGAYAWLNYSHHHNQTNQQSQDFTTLMNNVKKFRNLRQDNLAKSILLDFDKKYSSTETKSQRYAIALELVAIYQTQQDFKDALTWQQRALDSNPKPGFNDYNGLGEAYMAVGDKTNAIKYLKLALAEIGKPGTNPVYNIKKQFITDEIASLEQP